MATALWQVNIRINSSPLFACTKYLWSQHNSWEWTLNQYRPPARWHSNLNNIILPPRAKRDDYSRTFHSYSRLDPLSLVTYMTGQWGWMIAMSWAAQSISTRFSIITMCTEQTDSACSASYYGLRLVWWSVPTFQLDWKHGSWPTNQIKFS